MVSNDPSLLQAKHPLKRNTGRSATAQQERRALRSSRRELILALSDRAIVSASSV